MRQRMDRILDGVQTLYYHPRGLRRKKRRARRSRHLIVETPVGVGKTQYDSLELTLSALRKPLGVEQWTLKEVAVFEAGITRWGKDFERIARALPGKRTNEVVAFYYGSWKFSRHYYMWKNQQGGRRPKNEAPEPNVQHASVAELAAAAAGNAKLDGLQFDPAFVGLRTELAPHMPIVKQFAKDHPDEIIDIKVPGEDMKKAGYKPAYLVALLSVATPDEVYFQYHSANPAARDAFRRACRALCEAALTKQE